MGDGGKRENEVAVAIAGAGPAGLMLAAELTLAGVEVALLERRPSQALAGSRAGGLHARALELLDQRGVVERFLAAGETAQAVGVATNFLDISDFPSRHPYALGLWQNEIERLLAQWVGELGVTIRYGTEVVDFAPDEAGVELELAAGDRLRAGYLVGCDGGRSLVRKRAGIEFPGWEATTSNLIAEAEFAQEPEWGIRLDSTGVHSFNRIEDGPVRVLITERTVGGDPEPSLAELGAAIAAVYGTDFGVHSPTWISRFTDSTRQAAAYRAGRVLLAGDSAHVHYPSGGQGINLGLQDAVNLGWKLARVVAGTSPPDLLDTYQAERHPAAARALRHTMAQTALMRPGDERDEALRGEVATMLGMDETRRHFGALLSGLDVRYELGDGHPLLGRRMPDLDLRTAAGPRRTYSLLHRARPALLDFGGRGARSGAHKPWADRVPALDAEPMGSWELPGAGLVEAPAAVLVRPDGHVAWVGDGGDAGLAAALEKWFGAPAP